MKKKKIVYLSHGLIKTGGYRYENFLCDEISKYYTKQLYTVETKKIRKEKFYTGIFQHLYLLLWANINATASINIVVSRLAISAIIRNIFNNKKIIIVWHSYDSKEPKSLTLKIYYSCLFFMLKNIKMYNVQIVTGAHFWVDFFSAKIKHKNKVSYYPNLFDTRYYQTFISNKIKHQIHLGQWHSKNDKAIFELAKLLSNAGYTCYFSSNNQHDKKQDKDYEVRHFALFENYLQAMAQSLYTIAFTQTDEGWNRVSHESILVGTHVIGFNKGGLGELLHLSNSFIVNNTHEAYNIIIQNKTNNNALTFINMHDINNSELYLKNILV